MATEIISEIYDLAAISKQTAEVLGKINDVTVAMERSAAKIATCHTEITASGSFSELTKATGKFVRMNETYVTQAKELMRWQKEQMQLEQKLQFVYLETAKKIEQVRQEVAEETKAIRESAGVLREREKAEKNLSASMSDVFIQFRRQREAVAELTTENKRLREEMQAMDYDVQKEEIERINAVIQANTALIKMNASAYVTQKIDVDRCKNVLEGLGVVVGGLQGDMAKLAQSGMVGAEEFDKLTAGFEEARVGAEEYMAELSELSANSGRLQVELSGVKDQMQQMVLAGEMGSEKYLELSERAGLLTDSISEVDARMNHLQPPDAVFDAILGGLTGLAGGFEMVKGTMGLFNLESEGFEKVQSKIQSAITLTNGVITVKAALDKKGALMTALSTAAQSENLIVCKAATIAQRGLNLAMKSFPLLLVISALVAGVAALGNWLGAAKEVSEEQKRLNQVNEKAVDGYAKEKLEIESLSDKIKIGNVTREDQAKIVRILNTLHGESFTKNKDLKELEEKFINKAPAYVAALTSKAKAQAAFDLAVEKERELLLEQSKGVDEYVGAFNRFLMGADAAKVVGQERKKQAILAKQAEVEGFMVVANAHSGATEKIMQNSKLKTSYEIKEEEKSLVANQQVNQLKLKSEIDTQVEVLNSTKSSYKEKISALNEYTAKQIAAVRQQRDEALKNTDNKDERALIIRKAENDILKIRRQGVNEREKLDAQEVRTQNQILDIQNQVRMDASQRILRDEKATFAQKVAALEEYEDAQETSLKRQAQINMTGLDAGSSQAKLVQAQLEADLTALRAQGEQDREKIENEEAGRRIAEMQSRAEYSKSVLEEEYSDEAAALAQKYAEGNMTAEQYEKEKLELSKTYSKKAFDEDINALENIVNNSGLKGKDLADAQKALAEKKVEYTKWANEQIITEEENAAEKRLEAEKELQEAKSELMNEAISGVFSIMNSVSERKIQQIDEEIAKVDEQKEHDLEVVEEMDISQEEKEEKKKAIEAKAEAEKEKLEKKKKKEQLKQAKMEKAQALIDVAINTAKGIVAAWSNPFAAPALIPIIIATGAIQAATIAAQPLPKYAQGTDEHPGGLAIVGDGGKKELIRTPEGKYYVTPNSATLVNLPQYSQIFPDFNLALRNLFFNPIISDEMSDDNRRLEWRLSILEKAIRETTLAIIENKPEMNISFDCNGMWTLYDKKKGRTNYLNERLNIQK